MPSLIGCIPFTWTIGLIHCFSCCESYVKACPEPKHVGCCADAGDNSICMCSSRFSHASPDMHSCIRHMSSSRVSRAPPDMHSCIRHMGSTRLSHAPPDMHLCIRHMFSSKLGHAPPDMHSYIRRMCSLHTTP